MFEKGKYWNTVVLLVSFTDFDVRRGEQKYALQLLLSIPLILTKLSFFSMQVPYLPCGFSQQQAKTIQRKLKILVGNFG